MKILAFAASSSSKSINKILVTYATTLLEKTSTQILDLNDYELPMFSEDKEIEINQPDAAKRFLDKIADSDAIIVSFAEHNGSYSAVYKNLFDWCSRIQNKVYQNKPMILLSTSIGQGGGNNVLTNAVNSIPYFDGIVKGSFSLPSFHDNFNLELNKISNEELDNQLKNVMLKLNQ
jgi:NAD(P)H-dependent FMN reductase